MAEGELIPLLAELDDDEDEVLQAIAQQLGGLIELVGGSAQCGVLLVPLVRESSVLCGVCTVCCSVGVLFNAPLCTCVVATPNCGGMLCAPRNVAPVC